MEIRRAKWPGKNGKRVNMLVEILNEHCDSGLYILKYNILDSMVEGTRRFRTVTVFDITPHEHFKVHIKQAFRRTLQRRRT